MILSAMVFLIVESVNEFLFDYKKLILKIISIVIILIMAFVNGFISGKYNISEQMRNHVYIIFGIVLIIGYIVIHKIAKRKQN